MVHSQIWLNLPRDDRHISFHLPMHDRHLCSIKKLPQKTPTPVPTETEPSSSLQNVCVPRDNLYFYALMRSTHASDGWKRTPGLRPGSMRAVRHYVVRRTRSQAVDWSLDKTTAKKGTRVKRKKLNKFSMCVLDVFACTDSPTCSRSETREGGTNRPFPVIVLRSQYLFSKGCTERRRWSGEQWWEKRRGVTTMAMVVLKSSECTCNV